MEKSDHYYIRKERMKNLIVPTISEAQRELGDHLSYVLLEKCPDPLKPYMGLTPLLKGAGDDLWISPSDTIIGKVCLKPPVTSKHIKALTHEGILMIGRDIEDKFWNEAELSKNKALAEQEEMLLFMAELDKRKTVAAVRQEEKRKCEEEKQDMRVEFEKKLEQELCHLEKVLKRKYDESTRVQKIHLEKQWKEKLETAVSETVERLTNQFLEDLADQEKQLLKKFSIEMKKEEIKRKMEVKEAQDCCQETFQHLKHQLQCKNIANMMYVLCVERRKCQAERQQMEKDYQKEIHELHNFLAEKNIEITKLTREREEKIKQSNLREECILEILRQFQKFINFTLRASPTQAEFLLSIEKMMLFELAQAVTKTDKKHAKRLAKTLFAWKTESDLKSRTLSVKESLTSLIADDHHQCYNEKEPPETERDLTSSDYLPAFYYNKHMYVREDFRNMMSQGIEISPSNLIWNRDVENLMHVLKRSVTSLNKQRQEEEDEKERLRKDKEEGMKTKEEAAKEVKVKETIIEKTEKLNIPADDNHSVFSARPETSRKSIVCFKQSKDDGDLLFPIFESSSKDLLVTTPSELFNEISPKVCSSDDISMILTKECCKPCYIPQKRIDAPRESALPLIGTKNSLELHKEPSKVVSQHAHAQTDDENAEHMGILGARDSLYKHRMSLRPSTNKLREIPPKVIDLRRKSPVSIKSSSLKQIKSISRSSLAQNSKEPKKHCHVEEHTLVRKVSQQSELSRAKSETDDAVYNISKLSLTRDSYLVHKHSLIIKKQSQSKSYDNIKSHSGSRETIQLKRPPRLSDMPERTSLKKISRHKPSASDTQSYNLSISPSNGSAPKRWRIPTSKLTMSRDSLEIIRSHSRTSGLNHPKHRSSSKDSFEIKDGILGLHQLSQPRIKLDDDGSRTVRMSHIEILPLEDRPVDDLIYDTTVSDEEEETEKAATTNVCGAYNVEALLEPDSPWLIYQQKEPLEKDVTSPDSSRENFLTKPHFAHIGGDQEATEHLQKDKEFTIHRASSFISIFKKHPSLMKIFTPCRK